MKLARGEGLWFSDAAAPLISIINLASVRDLERVTGAAVDPLRFRGNILIDGLRPWGELDWPGRVASVAGTRLRILEPIMRCQATHVDPATAKRDLNIVGALERGFGHMDMGVYGEVVAGGAVAPGDEIALV